MSWNRRSDGYISSDVGSSGMLQVIGTVIVLQQEVLQRVVVLPVVMTTRYTANIAQSIWLLMVVMLIVVLSLVMLQMVALPMIVLPIMMVPILAVSMVVVSIVVLRMVVKPIVVLNGGATHGGVANSGAKGGDADYGNGVSCASSCGGESTGPATIRNGGRWEGRLLSHTELLIRFKYPVQQPLAAD